MNPFHGYKTHNVSNDVCTRDDKTEVEKRIIKDLSLSSTSGATLVEVTGMGTVRIEVVHVQDDDRDHIPYAEAYRAEWFDMVYQVAFKVDPEVSTAEIKPL